MYGTIWTSACYVTSILSIVTGLSLTVLWPEIFDQIMANLQKLAPNTELYEAWKQPPMDFNFDIYMYNWTNSEEFSNVSSKPVLEQLGPYRFKERQKKVNITWNSHNSTVTYRKLSKFFFDAKDSCGSLDDIITNLNPIAVGTSEKYRHTSFFRQKSIAIALAYYRTQITIAKTVRELLYDGYEDKLVTLSRMLPSIVGEATTMDRVGWFYARNGSADSTGLFNVGTHSNNFGTLQSWNFANTSRGYEGDCAIFRGSGGEFFPPNQQRGRISMFVPDMCRELPLDYEGEAVVHGITGYKYVGGMQSFNHERSCFPNEKIPPGLFNITACKFGMPAFVSFPHFYQADPYYASLVDGMEPDKSKHEMYIVLEPKTGTILEATFRVQINMLVRPNPSIPLLSNVSELFMPTIWIEQRVIIPQNFAYLLRVVLVMPIVGQVGGVMIAFIGVIILLRLRNSWNDSQQRIFKGLTHL